MAAGRRLKCPSPNAPSRSPCSSYFMSSQQATARCRGRLFQHCERMRAVDLVEEPVNRLTHISPIVEQLGLSGGGMTDQRPPSWRVSRYSFASPEKPRRQRSDGQSTISVVVVESDSSPSSATATHRLPKITISSKGQHSKLKITVNCSNGLQNTGWHLRIKIALL